MGRKSAELNKSDPRTWPALVQDWEAHKAIKQIQTGPRERIPAAVFSSMIALNYGIRRDDVTWEQTRSAMADLSHHYGTLVEVVPSPTVTAPPDDLVQQAQAAGNGPTEHSLQEILQSADQQAERVAVDPQPGRENASRAPEVPKLASSWADIEIRFLSDERVQICAGDDTETRNYAELGFEDRRNGKPNRAWVTLRILAEQNGTIRQVSTAQDWKVFEKRIQEIRKVLRNCFNINADPLPFIEGTGYQARFKINCGPSYNS